MLRTLFLRSLLLAGASFGPVIAVAQDSLADGFENPPAEVRPRVWWHWLNGAISEQGIEKDLAWLDRSGIGGVQIFNGAMPSMDKVETPRLRYMTPEWQRSMRLAVRGASRRGMEVTIPTSAGWSETGAPFVAPADGMKKYVWTETEVAGGRPFTGKLPRPSDVPGPIGAVDGSAGRLLTGEPAPVAPRLYADSRVFAYPVSAAEHRLPLPKVTTAKGPVPAEGLFDGRPAAAIEIDRPSRSSPGWVQFDYDRPVTLRSLSVILEGKKPEIGVSTSIPARLEVGDGTAFRKVADVPAGAFTQNTVSFAPVTGRIFRIVFQPASGTGPGWFDMAPGALLMPGVPAGGFARTLAISELRLSGDPQIHRFEEKAGFSSVPDYFAVPTPEVEAASAISRTAVIDLSGRMRPDGSLAWTPPPGRWRVVRLGYSLTGHMNGPASLEATGLEVDKLSAPRVRAYMDRYLEQYREALGSDRAGLGALLSDSIEAGHQNWTDDILAQFARRRGYDPTPWLPVLTGRIVDSAAASDAFLFDFRQTLSDLLAEAHYATVAGAAKASGLTIYGEALESPDRPSIGDDLAMRRYADIPMGAMWTFNPDKGPRPAHAADIKGAASAAHLYGRKFVGAESMTSIFQYWSLSPRDLKPVADTEFALGVNRLSIHSSVHQPLGDQVPGLSLWLFGLHFNRNESWAGQARPWIDYLARTSWLLSQGRYGADVAYFYGEEAPIVTLAEDGRLADVPVGYGYDFVNAGVLRDLIEVEDGALVTRSGMRYRALQLGGSSQHMTLPTLRRIEELAKAGATIVGARPLSSPSLADDPQEFKAIADRLWGAGGALGARVRAGETIEAVLAELGVTPDHHATGENGGALRFLRRTLDKGDIWFVSNPTRAPFRGEITLRTVGREPELWDAETGAIRPLSYRTEGDHMVIPLDLEASDAALIVFRNPTRMRSRHVETPSERTLSVVEGEWEVRFEPGRGAPSAPVAMTPGNWAESDVEGIRYFSGVATYSKTIHIPRREQGHRLLLALGEVRDLAEVWVNGRHVRTLWRPPYRVDISDAVRPGANRVEIKVANRWVNRLIGDAQPGAEKVTWTAAQPYSPKAPLVPSGLIGPVTLIETGR